MTRSARPRPEDGERRSIVALEPWLSGSHERFLAQWCARSRHDVAVLGLPARDWKWRMRSAAFELAERVVATDMNAPDVIFASDYVDLPSLCGWLPASWSHVPCTLYFHENQLTYPLRPGAEPNERDLHFAFTNVASIARATRVAFNSRFHRDEVARAGEELFARLPRTSLRDAFRAKLASADVIAPGIDLDEIALGRGGERDAPLRVLFNHRWEHDKDPHAFLSAAREAISRGAKLELVLLGERFGDLPPGTAQLLRELAPAIATDEFVQDRAQYAAALARCDVAASTARHEFFGLSIAEAMAAGCTPFVPRALSYPELVPPSLASDCFHAHPSDLARKLGAAARAPDAFRDPARRAQIRAAAETFSADESARRMDALCQACIAPADRDAGAMRRAAR
jgi:glycosyltransferase involved in cell wall biosynthesis